MLFSSLPPCLPHPRRCIVVNIGFFIEQDLTVGQFVYVIRKRIKLAPEKAIFIFVDEILPPTAALMSTIYEEHKCVVRGAHDRPKTFRIVEADLVCGGVDFWLLQGRGWVPLRQLQWSVPQDSSQNSIRRGH
jgi:hypothetical protein